MKKVLKSTQFKKDYKRFRHKTEKLKSLYRVLALLEQTGRVPLEYGLHKLHGIYEGCMECHVEDDFLLIWIDETTNTIRLVRLGTHHDLFGF